MTFDLDMNNDISITMINSFFGALTKDRQLESSAVNPVAPCKKRDLKKKDYKKNVPVPSRGAIKYRKTDKCRWISKMDVVVSISLSQQQYVREGFLY